MTWSDWFNAAFMHSSPLHLFQNASCFKLISANKTFELVYSRGSILFVPTFLHNLFQPGAGGCFRDNPLNYYQKDPLFIILDANQGTLKRYKMRIIAFRKSSI